MMLAALKSEAEKRTGRPSEPEAPR